MALSCVGASLGPGTASSRKMRTMSHSLLLVPPLHTVLPDGVPHSSGFCRYPYSTARYGHALNPTTLLSSSPLATLSSLEHLPGFHSRAPSFHSFCTHSLGLPILTHCTQRAYTLRPSSSHQPPPPPATDGPPRPLWPPGCTHRSPPTSQLRLEASNGPSAPRVQSRSQDERCNIHLTSQAQSLDLILDSAVSRPPIQSSSIRSIYLLCHLSAPVATLCSNPPSSPAPVVSPPPL